MLYSSDALIIGIINSYDLEDEYCSDIDHQNKHVQAQSLMGPSFSITDRAATWILKVQEQYKIPQSIINILLKYPAHADCSIGINFLL